MDQPDPKRPQSAAPAPAAPQPAAPRITFSAPVVIPALLVLGALLILCGLFPRHADRIFSTAQGWVIGHFDWLYTIIVSLFPVFLAMVAFSRFGSIRLGPDDAKPEFSFVSWSAMLFAAGMGIGLMYFGVGEPLQHYLNPPTQPAGTPAAAREALTSTFFHWGIHAWSVYGVMGLVLAYFGFRYNLPLTMRSGLYPLLQQRINGPIGHGVDTFALVGTIAGLATTLGYGALQLAAGLNIVTGWDTSTTAFRVGLIVLVVGMAGLSAASGLDKGVRRLSEINLLLTLILLGFVLVFGPTVYLFQAFSENVGNYLSNVVGLSLRTFAYEPAQDPAWFGSWTILYWAWWVSWSPFVGMFIARISRGRTVREFIVGVLLIPTAFNLLWMTAFGNGAIWIDTHVAQGALAQTAGNVDALLFRFFEYLPLAKAVSWLAIVLIALFFVTSADSGAYVVDAIASRGHPRSPVWQRLFWAAVLGVVAIALLLAGGLKALQALTLIAALPVAIIMAVLCVGLWRGMQADLRNATQDWAPATSFWNGEHWRKRLELIVRQPSATDIQSFLQKTVLPAMREVAAEMQRQGVHAVVQDDSANLVDGHAGAVQLHIPIAELRDFVYGVRPVKRKLPGFILTEVTDEEENARRHVVEPMTFFADGREGYDIQYLRPQELIADILRNYERYLSLSADKRNLLLNRAPGHNG